MNISKLLKDLSIDESQYITVGSTETDVLISINLETKSGTYFVVVVAKIDLK